MSEDRPVRFPAIVVLLIVSCGTVHDTSNRPERVPDAAGDSAPSLPFACNGAPCETLFDVDRKEGNWTAVQGSLVSPCCTPEGTCGATTKMAPGTCLPLHAPGGADPVCPQFETSHGRAAGCCTSDGHCGGDLGGREGPPWQLGCVTGAVWGQPEQSCSFDPKNDCTEITPVSCDGPEDCAAGMKCCGVRDSFGTTLGFQCLTGCGLWQELCHFGATCERPNAGGGSTIGQCKQDGEFPFLGSCPGSALFLPPAPASTVPGEINCGDAGVCAPGTQCCFRLPYGPYCGPSDRPCSCKP